MTVYIYKKPRYPPRRRRFQRKRRYRKRRRVPRSIRQNYLTTKQVVTSTLTLPASAVSSDFQSNYHNFALNQIDPGQLTAFRKLFNEFTLKGIKVSFMNTVSNVAAPGSTSVFKMSLCPTPDPYASAVDWVSQSQGPDANAKTRQKYLASFKGQPNPVMSAKLVPRASTQINNPGAVPAGLVTAHKNLWLNCMNNMGTLHSGLRIGCEWQEPHPLVELQVITTYIIAFRRVV